STGNAFIINSLPYPNEFYVLEFRRRNDFFEHLLYGTGLVVYRINTDLIGNAGGPPDEIYVYRYNGTIEQNGDIYLSYFSDKALNEMDAINDSTNPSGFLSNGIPGGLHIQNVKVYDDSLTFYAYIRPTLSLKYPNGGQLYSGFSKQKIEWKSTAIDSLNIEYSPDNGNSWHLIKKNLPADPSSFIWTLPDINTTLCKIRISNAAGPKISAVNPAPFSIKKLELLNLSVLNSIYIGAKSLRTASVNDYLFVASNDYLKIFNKKEPNEPLEISYNDKPSDIKNIVIEDNRAYVHCNYYGPYEQILKIYDISDPAKPVLLGQYWHIADNFTVKNKIIYMAAWDELHVVDAKDPAYPKAINNLKSSVVITTAVNDKYGYFGSRSGVKYFDISDPSKSVILNPADSTIPVSAMAISGKYLYALTIYGVIIYDLLDYGKPYERKLLKLPEMPGFSSHSQIYAAGNLLVISYPEAGMLIYDITDRLQPVLKSRFCANSETMGSSFDGIYFYIATFSEGIYIAAIPGPTDVESSAAPIIYSSSLEQNFPNPFNPLTTIRYSVSVNTKVLLKVYDVLGKEAAILVDEFKSPGNYSVDFNGSSLSSGIYFYRITCGNFTETKKLVLIK
ncbi:MAG: T9SS type A sorting domain-containing protein, partial [Bacillota bacterium]